MNVNTLRVIKFQGNVFHYKNKQENKLPIVNGKVYIDNEPFVIKKDTISSYLIREGRFLA
jgi:hypothetical protein